MDRLRLRQISRIAKIIGGNYDMREIILCGVRATRSETKVEDFERMIIEIMTAQVNLIAAILVALLDSNIVFFVIIGSQQSFTDSREISFGWRLNFLCE